MTLCQPEALEGLGGGLTTYQAWPPTASLRRESEGQGEVTDTQGSEIPTGWKTVILSTLQMGKQRSQFLLDADC